MTGALTGLLAMNIRSGTSSFALVRGLLAAEGAMSSGTSRARLMGRKECTPCTVHVHMHMCIGSRKGKGEME